MKTVAPFVAGLIALITASFAFAATIRVPEDYSTVPNAIDAALPGDTVLIGPGTWTDRESRVVNIPGGGPALFTSCGYLKGGISVIGAAGAEATIINGGNDGPGSVNTFMFVNFPGQSCALEGLTITGGELAAVFASDSGMIIIRNCRINGNAQLTESGSAVRMDVCDLILEDSEVSFNAGGGGVDVGNASLEMRRCHLEGNECGAVGFAGGGTPSLDRAIVADCQFIGNRSICTSLTLLDQDELVVTGNLFLRNVVTTGQGCAGMYVGGEDVDGDGGEIRFNTFAYDSSYTTDSIGGLWAAFFHGEITNNTFVGCHTPDPGWDAAGSAVGLYPATTVTFANNVIVGSTGQPAVQIQGDTQSILHSCNVFWNNARGDYFVEKAPIPPDILAGPLFCDPMVLDFTIAANSPCAPGVSPGCGLIGAWPVACGGIAVESKSWGAIKALYR